MKSIPSFALPIHTDEVDRAREREKKKKEEEEEEEEEKDEDKKMQRTIVERFFQHKKFGYCRRL